MAVLLVRISCGLPALTAGVGPGLLAWHGTLVHGAAGMGMRAAGAKMTRRSGEVQLSLLAAMQALRDRGGNSNRLPQLRPVGDEPGLLAVLVLWRGSAMGLQAAFETPGHARCGDAVWPLVCMECAAVGLVAASAVVRLVRLSHAS
jgi:hypothetical protein